MLTDKEARGLKARATGYEVADGKVNGLALRVLPSGSKRWAYRYRTPEGGWRRVAVGAFPDIGVKDARDIAAAHHVAIRRDGTDPSATKRAARQAKTETFGALCDLYIERWAKARKRSWKVDRRMLATQVPRSWRQRPAVEITRRDVADLTEGKSIEAPIQANRLRALLHKVFNFATEREIVPFNPVTRTPRPGVERQRDRVLSEDEIRQFWTETEAMSAPMRALWRLRLVTAQRSAELIGLEWDHLDLDASDGPTWTIPAGLAKNKKAHRVPLSPLAVEIIRELPRVVAVDPQAKRRASYVLAGARGNRQVYEAAKLVTVPEFKGHDLRRTAASYMASAGVPRHHIGRVLNHAEQGVTAVYDRHGYDPEKRAALLAWEARLLAILGRAEGGEVLAFSAKRARRDVG